MSIYETVTTQMKEAMKARQADRLGALRAIRAAFLTEMKKNNAAELDDAICITLLRRLEKQRRESIEAFANAGRDEQAAAETAELEVLQEFLPSLADEATTRAWVEKAVTETGAQGPRDVGRVMGALMKAHRGEMDGGLAQRMAAELLAGGDGDA